MGYCSTWWSTWRQASSHTLAVFLPIISYSFPAQLGNAEFKDAFTGIVGLMALFSFDKALLKRLHLQYKQYGGLTAEWKLHLKMVWVALNRFRIGGTLAREAKLRRVLLSQ